MVNLCPKCNGRGLIVSDNSARPCPCSKERALANRINESGLPTGLLGNRFEGFNFRYYSKSTIDPVKGISHYDSARLTFRAATDFVKSFMQNSRATKGLLFTGGVGSGKTHLACCIANALLDRGWPVLFVVVPDLLDRIKATYDPGRQGGYSEQEVIDAAREVPLLLLDDLGAHNYTDWTRNKLYSIINYRLNYCLPTVITTNISLEDLEEFLGERTTSRIFQMCRTYRLMVDVDIRMKKQGVQTEDWQ